MDREMGVGNCAQPARRCRLLAVRCRNCPYCPARVRNRLPRHREIDSVMPRLDGHRPEIGEVSVAGAGGGVLPNSRNFPS